MRVGIVCPYAWDVPGGVQNHVRDLAEELLRVGHDVSVLTPANDEGDLPPYVVPAGRAVPVPYNGSVARLLLGPISASRVRKWLRSGHFDVLHVHEPTAPSISLVACWFATGPIVSTHHNSTARSRAMTAFAPALLTALEKIQGRIAVSEAARSTIVGHIGGDAVVIPNGVSLRHFADAEPLPGHPDGRSVVFLGRIDEPRKGLAVLLGAMHLLWQRGSGARLLVAGPGDVDELRDEVPTEAIERAELLGLVSEEHKAQLLRSADVFCAPNLGGESFGMVLTEAMAAGAPVVASDLDAFRRVLDDGTAGLLFPAGDEQALSRAIEGLLSDPPRRAELSQLARKAVIAYDWETVAADVLEVYETVVAGHPGVDIDPAAGDLPI